ncbi:hypothetical protein ABI59_10705 [Acidobacteria bacterium Mor1]|nr:hypothetical protein ABI59_10705 [Acidobacteria bacterium Mor1]
MSYALTRRAERDIDEILDYIAEQDSLDRAYGVHRRFVEAFELLARNPRIGAPRNHLTPQADLRWWVVIGFSVLYRPDPRPLTIMRVLHGARDIERMVKRRPSS